MRSSCPARRESAPHYYRDAGTSLRTVAESAGLAPETIFDIFGAKRSLLEAVADAAITEGIDEPDDWLERSWAREILALDDPAERLRRWLAHTAATLARTSPVHAVLVFRTAFSANSKGVNVAPCTKEPVECHTH